MYDETSCGGDDSGGPTGGSSNEGGARSTLRKSKSPKKNMKRLTWGDIPLPILKSIFRKWYRILGSGVWSDDLWAPCALCRHMMNKVAIDKGFSKNDHCRFCPTVRSAWCRNYHRKSRLSFLYHKPDKKAWLKAVALFVAMMRDLIDRYEGKE